MIEIEEEEDNIVRQAQERNEVCHLVRIGKDWRLLSYREFRHLLIILKTPISSYEHRKIWPTFFETRDKKIISEILAEERTEADEALGEILINRENAYQIIRSAR